MIVNEVQLAEALRLCADYITENAQNLVGNTLKQCCSVVVTISMPPQEVPTVTVERKYFVPESVKAFNQTLDAETVEDVFRGLLKTEAHDEQPTS